MKVALSFPGCHRRGGVERVMLECANFLASRGHEVHAYASEWDPEAMHGGIVRHDVRAWCGLSAVRLVFFARQVQRRLKERNGEYDVVASFGIQSPKGSVAWATSVHKTWIETSRGHRLLLGRMKQRLNPFHPVALAMERRFFGSRRYGKVIALTEEVKRDLLRFYGVPAEDVVVIPNGYSPSEFNVERVTRERAAQRSRLGYVESDKVIIFVANELERKGFGPLLRAMAALRDPRVHLLAVGRLDAWAYRDEIERLGLLERIRFTGPTNDVAGYYAAADVFALPTEYEAWGLVIVEAMACGLPVLTSRLAGAAVSVQEGCNGLLLDDPRDVTEIAGKLQKILGWQHASPEAISQSVVRYAWSEVLKDYERVLMSCAQKAEQMAG
jgi:UDP-glucose:(heptosyl)LPS alpha-1,3-glucosyltransferase